MTTKDTFSKYELASKLLACGNGGIYLGCPVSFCRPGRYRFGVSFFRVARLVFAVVLTSLYSLNNHSYYSTMTVILTPTHILRAYTKPSTPPKTFSSRSSKTHTMHEANFDNTSIETAHPRVETRGPWKGGEYE